MQRVVLLTVVDAVVVVPLVVTAVLAVVTVVALLAVTKPSNLSFGRGFSTL